MIQNATHCYNGIKHSNNMGLPYIAKYKDHEKNYIKRIKTEG